MKPDFKIKLEVGEVILQVSSGVRIFIDSDDKKVLQTYGAFASTNMIYKKYFDSYFILTNF